jgi:transcriptional regulator with XRE-family HTH domain
MHKRQADVAKKAGITRPHLSDIENGKVDVSIYVLHLIADALDVTLSKLLEGVG